MSNKPPVKFDYVILCDDVRKEDNGKLLLIGIYTGNILVPKFPTKLRLSCYFHGIARLKGEFPIEIRYKAAFETADPFVLQGFGAVTVNDARNESEISLPVASLPVELAEPGVLSVDYRLKGGRWKTLLTKSVQLNEALTNEQTPSS